MLGMSGAFSTAKAACSTEPLCKRLIPPISFKTAFPSFMLFLICAVAGQVQQYAGQLAVVFLDIDATDQISRVFTFCQPSGCGGRGSFFRQNEYGRAACSRLDKSIGVNGNQQVSLNGPGFLDACTQRNKEIGITGHDDSHIGLLFDFRFQSFANGGNHVFLFAASCPDGTGSLPRHDRDRPQW